MRGEPVVRRENAAAAGDGTQATRPLKPLSPQCKGFTRRGTPCRFLPEAGQDFCIWHSPDPEQQQKAKAAAHKGSLYSMPRHLAPDAPAASIRNLEDALALTEETVNGVRTGILSPNIANSVFYGISVAAKLLELQVLDKLEAIEAAIAVRASRRVT
jgi:hypothetical protein